MKPTINRPGKPAGPRPPANRAGSATQASASRAASAARMQTFFTGVVSEMKRVTWPSREEWVTATLLTLGLVIVVGLYTAAADHLFGWLVGLVTGNATR
jgi:preprotein translocase SecE subunit